MKLEVITVAEKYIGVPFLYHQHDYHEQDPAIGFDCSGFVRFVLKEAGYNIPEEVIHAREFFDFYGKFIPKEEVLPGDLIFFTQRGTMPSHIGFVAGIDIVLHCSSRVPGVGYSSLEFLHETIFPLQIDINAPTRRPKKYFSNPIGFKRY